jgi:leishmanolysin-like peptidase
MTNFIKIIFILGLTVGYAAHCQQESSLDRPIAGHANLCPDSISTKPQELQTLLSTVKHEILHALGRFYN